MTIESSFLTTHSFMFWHQMYGIGKYSELFASISVIWALCQSKLGNHLLPNHHCVTQNEKGSLWFISISIVSMATKEMWHPPHQRYFQNQLFLAWWKFHGPPTETNFCNPRRSFLSDISWNAHVPKRGLSALKCP